MDYNFSQLLDEIKNTLFKGSLAMLASAVISRLLAPKRTEIIVDNDVPAELYTVGQKDGPKAVYVTTKKHSVNLVPTILMLLAGILVWYIKKCYDESHNAAEGTAE